MRFSLLLFAAVLSNAFPGTLTLQAKRAPTVGDLLRRDSVEAATEYLRLSGKKWHSTQLMQLAGKFQGMQGDPNALDKVKGLIRHMIAQALTVQAKDTTRSSFCKTETVKSAEKLKRLVKDVERGQADVDLKEAKMGELKEQIQDLHENLAAMEKDNMEAAAKREAAKSAFEEQKAEFDSEGHQGSLRGSEGEERAAAKRQAEAIERRIEAEQKERDAAFKYKAFQEKQFETKAAKTEGAKKGNSDLIFMNRGLFEAKRDLDSTKQELSASQDYSEKLTRDCTVGPKPDQERRERREREIDSLKEAHQILTGEAIPVDLN